MESPTTSKRHRKILALADLTQGRGLEIGPLASAIAERPGLDVRYVDAWSQKDLRAHYFSDPNVNGDDIPEMDFVLIQQDGVLDLATAVARDAPYTWVVASHVIEHVPDVIGWLADIAKVTTDGADLILAVPDRRYCFDARRQATSVGQMIHAHDLESTVPSVRAVFDHFREAVSVDSAALWKGVEVTDDARIHGLEQTLDLVGKSRSGVYVDCHVWTFTPKSFADQIHELGRIGLCDFVLHDLVPTEQDELEFYAVLRRLPRGLDRVDVLTRVEAAGADAAGVASTADSVERSGTPANEVEVLALEVALATTSARCAQLEIDLATIKASERWRVGGALVGPAARLLGAVRGRRGRA